MKRLLLVLTIASVMLAMTAAPAFAQLGDIPPPDDKAGADKPRDNAQPPKTDVTNPTEQNGKTS